jgi:glycosyltransferase involved in cell wall biosynthesis
MNITPELRFTAERRLVSEQPHGDIVERDFTLDGIDGILWLPESASAERPVPLILLGYPSGPGLARIRPRLEARARSSAELGFASITLEMPGNGARPALPELESARADLMRALDAGDLDAARALRAEDGRELPELAAFLASAGDEYADQARGSASRVTWTGRLDHDELAEVLPAAEALVAPSTFPEAFGMVAAEGAACGALPVVARHSGLAEVSEALAARVPEAARGWLSFGVGPGAVEELAACLNGWLAAPGPLREEVRDAIVAVTRERWSWDGVARTVIAAATGELDDLPEP